MKSMKPKTTFNLEDFEKGLMLLGYVMPANTEEVEEKDALAQFEKEQGDENHKNYFRRVVLAAEIAEKLHEEPTMGRVKFQKLVYLCEYMADMDLAHRYQKQTPGPFDNKFMHSVAREFKSNKWFETKVIHSGGSSRTVYKPMENSIGYKKYYDRYFGTFDSRIQQVINLFRKQNTANTELAATVHYCLCELASQKQPVTKDALMGLFYGWSEAKGRFSEGSVLDSARWLKDNNLIKIEVLA